MEDAGEESVEGPVPVSPFIIVVGVFALRISVRGSGEDSREDAPQATTEHRGAKI